MIRYLIRRVLYAIPTLIGVMLFTFALFYMTVTPDELARRNLSTKSPTAKQIHQWQVDNGYDKPLQEQFKNHIEKLLLLDFGKSDRTKEPIWDRIKQGAVPSFQVAAMVVLTTLVVSITLAMLSAYFRGTFIDRTMTITAVVLMSVVYVVYVLGIQFLLGKVLKYGPLAGYHEGLGSWRFVLIPVLIGLVARVGGDTRLFRTFLLDEMSQDYVRTARAKGVPEVWVLFRHVLKNAMVPVITTTVALIPTLILGSLILESYFAIPGIGSFLQDAIQNNDFAVVRAMVYLGSILYILGLMLTDIMYAVVDPRVRVE